MFSIRSLRGASERSPGRAARCYPAATGRAGRAGGQLQGLGARRGGVGPLWDAGVSAFAAVCARSFAERRVAPVLGPRARWRVQAVALRPSIPPRRRAPEILFLPREVQPRPAPAGSWSVGRPSCCSAGRLAASTCCPRKSPGQQLRGIGGDLGLGTRRPLPAPRARVSTMKRNKAASDLATHSVSRAVRWQLRRTLEARRHLIFSCALCLLALWVIVSFSRAESRASAAGVHRKNIASSPCCKMGDLGNQTSL